MFLDASAIVAILAREDGWEAIQKKLQAAGTLSVSPLSLWESARALRRSYEMPLEEAERIVWSFAQVNQAQSVAIDDEIAREALRASRLFGKGHHRAKLNMGDCFAYACAKVLDVPLLCKGEDFPLTDIRLA